jgi:hypothetical protein
MIPGRNNLLKAEAAVVVWLKEESLKLSVQYTGFI